MEQVITARGHPVVLGTHESTLEVTTDDFLTPAGDCIIGVEADVAPSGFDQAFVDACCDDEAEIQATIEAGGYRETISGRGATGLTFDDDRSAVLRTSEYIDDRTVMINADRAAVDLDRGLIEELKEAVELVMTLSVHP